MLRIISGWYFENLRPFGYRMAEIFTDCDYSKHGKINSFEKSPPWTFFKRAIAIREYLSHPSIKCSQILGISLSYRSLHIQVVIFRIYSVLLYFTFCACAMADHVPLKG